MGWSCSAAAAERERVMSNVCRRTTNSQNAYVGTDGVTYFYEPSRTEHADGAITGSVYTMTGRKVGTFRIDGDGTVSRWPKAFPRAIAAVPA